MGRSVPPHGFFLTTAACEATMTGLAIRWFIQVDSLVHNISY